jgi:hypothetical protein
MKMHTIKLFLSVGIIVFCLALRGSAEPTPEDIFARSQAATAVQLWYVNGVPHTDANGNPMMTYDPKRSFFPIGLWGCPMHEEGTDYDWKNLRGLGVNTVWSWSYGLDTLNTADRFGFQIIFGGPIAQDTLKAIAGHPRLLGNDWKDEPIGQLLVPGRMEEWFGQFQEYKKLVHETAPPTLVFCNSTAWIQPPATEWSIRWNTAGDVVCHDNYPIKVSCSNTRTLAAAPIGVPQSTSFFALCNNERKPNWVIIGAFDDCRKGPGQPDNLAFRYASCAQLRAQVYLSLIHGATGIHYFIWDSPFSRAGNILGMSPNPKARIPGYEVRISAAQRGMARGLWETVSLVNAELRELTPALLSPTADPARFHYTVNSKLFIGSAVLGESSTPNPVRTLLKTVPGSDELIMLTANADAGVIDSTIRFDRKIESVEVLFDSLWPEPVLDPEKHKFQLRYDPFDAHVLKIKLKK